MEPDMEAVVTQPIPTDDPLETIPPPDEVKRLIAESVRRTELLRSLLTTSERIARYQIPTYPVQAREGVCR
jgi:hypothetical protein